jgi:hypothetical protein
MSHLSASDHSHGMLTAAERDLLRRDLCVRFGTPPKLADGIFLRVWRSGPLAGQPKVPAALQSMVDRGLMVVHAGSPHMARACFTDAGFAALRWLAALTMPRTTRSGWCARTRFSKST